MRFLFTEYVPLADDVDFGGVQEEVPESRTCVCNNTFTVNRQKPIDCNRTHSKQNFSMV